MNLETSTHSFLILFSITIIALFGMVVIVDYIISLVIKLLDKFNKSNK